MNEKLQETLKQLREAIDNVTLDELDKLASEVAEIGWVIEQRLYVLDPHDEYD